MFSGKVAAASTWPEGAAGRLRARALDSQASAASASPRHAPFRRGTSAGAQTAKGGPAQGEPGVGPRAALAHHGLQKQDSAGTLWGKQESSCTQCCRFAQLLPGCTAMRPTACAVRYSAAASKCKRRRLHDRSGELPPRCPSVLGCSQLRALGKREEHTHTNAERETQQRVVKSPCNCCQEEERGRERHRRVRCKLPSKTSVLQPRLRPGRRILYPAKITRSPGAQARPRRRGTRQTSPRCRSPSRRAPPAAAFRPEGSPQTQRCRC